MSTFRTALRLHRVDVDSDEVECMVANMIYRVSAARCGATHLHQTRSPSRVTVIEVSVWSSGHAVSLFPTPRHSLLPLYVHCPRAMSRADALSPGIHQGLHLPREADGRPRQDEPFPESTYHSEMTPSPLSIRPVPGSKTENRLHHRY
jgi:hypothetical protein